MNEVKVKSTIYRNCMSGIVTHVITEFKFCIEAAVRTC